MDRFVTFGTNILGTVAPAWSVSRIADFNGDGKADLLWRDTSGTLAVWFLNGASVSGTALLGNVATTGQIQ
jgi:hypothetical protein